MPPHLEDMLSNDIRPFIKHSIAFGPLSENGWCSAYFPNPTSDKIEPEMLLGSAQKDSDGYTIYVAPNQVYFADLNGVLLPGRSFTTHPSILKNRKARERNEEVSTVITLSLALGMAAGLILADSPQLRQDLSSSLDNVRVAVTQLIFE